MVTDCGCSDPLESTALVQGDGASLDVQLGALLVLVACPLCWAGVEDFWENTRDVEVAEASERHLHDFPLGDIGRNSSALEPCLLLGY